MKQFLIKAIKRYQKTLSPKLYEKGVRCLFVPSCSQYGVEVLEKHSVVVALTLIAYRILSCNPINAYYKSKITIKSHGKRI